MNELSKKSLSFLAQGLLDASGMVGGCSGGRGVAVDNGDRHGGGVASVNSYGGSCRHVYHGRSTAGVLTTFRTIGLLHTVVVDCGVPRPQVFPIPMKSDFFHSTT